MQYKELASKTLMEKTLGQLFSPSAFRTRKFCLNVSLTSTAIHSSSIEKKQVSYTLLSQKTNISKIASELINSDQYFESN